MTYRYSPPSTARPRRRWGDEMEEITVEAYRKLKKAPKYGNRKAECDGHVFDSQAEVKRYKELLLLNESGAIEDLEVHPRYELQPAFRDKRGRKHRAIVYFADFRYIEVIDPQSIMGRSVVEDTKGKRTKEFCIKEKLFRFRYPDIDLRILNV
jgi:hypothetical protein